MTVFSKDNQGTQLKGWRDTIDAKIWRFSLRPKDNPVSSIYPYATAPTAALNSHELPSVGALVRYSMPPLDSQ